MHPTLLIGFFAASVCACQQRADSAEARGDTIAPRSAELAQALASDPQLKAADSTIRRGNPWRATIALTPLLNDAARRSPATVLLAARAAAGWQGWSEVDRLLSSEPWLDERFGGEGYELLARSALARDADSLAAMHARSAAERAGDPRTRGTRWVLLARALDRRNERDSARVAYERGAASVREARDWLLLRAAGVTSDSADRAKQYADVRAPIARDRIKWTEAQAFDRAGDVERAAAAYAALGETVTAIRLRLATPLDSVARAGYRSELISVVRQRAGTPAARQAVELLDKYFATPAMALSPAEELLIARSSAASGPVSRAVTAYASADAAGLLTDSDRYKYADLLGRSNRSSDAMAQYRRVGGALAGDAAYQRARLLLNSDGAAARTLLRDIRTRYASDVSAAAPATYLLADLTTDDGRDDDARTLFRDLYRRFPSHALADEARFRAAMIAYIKGQQRTAARELDSLVAVMPRSGEAMAARYWSGKAWAAAGNPATARARWRDAISTQPMSYYSSMSAKRLGEKPFIPPEARDTFPQVPAVDSAMRRIAILEGLGMDTEARFEYDALEEAASTSTPRLVATARALRDHGETTRAIKLANMAVSRGLRDASIYRLVYPLIDGDQLVAQSKARKLDPALVAGLIRQESNFNPRALSVAGARGLMQVMPSVGEQIARQLRFPVWDSRLLFDADASLQIGTAHLATSLQQYDSIARALAAYNAGGSRVRRWATKQGVDDPELFTERIPFVETRDYVRIVQRNAELYRALYDLQ